MSGPCKDCARLKAAYRLLERDQERASEAIDRSIGVFMDHLAEAEAEAYDEAMAVYLRTRGDEEAAAKLFLTAYGRALARGLRLRGCDLGLASRELRSWIPSDGRDYTAARIGFSLVERAGPEAAGRPLLKTVPA